MMTKKPSKVGQGELFFCCAIRVHKQVYVCKIESLCCSTLVNIQTHRQTAFDQLM